MKQNQSTILHRAVMTLALLLTTAAAWAGSKPTGSLEVCTGGPMSVYVKGWAYDPDNESATVSVRVEVYNDEACTDASTIYSSEQGVLTANKARTDVAALNGVAGNHGFEGYIEVGTADGENKWVKVYTVDATDGDVQLGVKTQVLVKVLHVGYGNIVTPDNMDDIFGWSAGSIPTFDNATNTLTISVPDGADKDDIAIWSAALSPDAFGTIISANFDLTIAGNWHITEDWMNQWITSTWLARQLIKCTGSLTFDGDFTLLQSRNMGEPDPNTPYKPVVYAGGDITLRRGSLVVGSLYGDCALRAGGALNVESGFTRLELKGCGHEDVNDTKYSAMKAQSLTLASGISIVEPTDGTFDSNEKTIVHSDGKTHAFHIIIASEEGAAKPAVLNDWNIELVESGVYDLWLGDTQVTYLNRNDILGDGGKATFDLDNNILTLNDPTISGTHQNATIYVGNVYVENINSLTIAGSYHMAEAKSVYGIKLSSTTTFDGDFTFWGTDVGIDAYKNIVLKSGSVMATGGFYGIRCIGDFIAEKGSVTAEGIEYWGIWCNNLVIHDGTDFVDMTSHRSYASYSALKANGLTLDDNYAITTPNGGILKSNEIYYANGIAKATHVVITHTTSVTFAKEGFSTYYDSQYDLVLPSGVKAYIITAQGSGQTLTYLEIADGSTSDNVVPKGTAVMLRTAASAAAQSIDISLASPTATAISETNLLYGSDTQTTTTGGGDGAKYYKLSYGTDQTANGGDDLTATLGWFWGEDNGAAFTSAAHKCWLALPAGSLARAFVSLPGDDEGVVTGIVDIEHGTWNSDHSAGTWYSLDGRRLNGRPSAKGVYVHNGKKVVIK